MLRFIVHKIEYNNVLQYVQSFTSKLLQIEITIRLVAGNDMLRDVSAGEPQYVYARADAKRRV